MVQNGGSMKLTKYEHACIGIEKDDQIVIVDPGNFSWDFIPPEKVVAVIITHSHTDHLDRELLAGIIDKNPEAIILGHPLVMSEIEVFTTKSVEHGESAEIGPFRFKFFGGHHATIHETIAPMPNLGVMINDLLYYPGDSLVKPDTPVDTLALPISGPWVKTGEVMDFLLSLHPRFAFPTHDALLSDEGKAVTDRFVDIAAKKSGTEYTRITSPIEI